MLSTGYTPYFENAALCVLEYPGRFAISQYKPGKRTVADLQAASTHLGKLLRQRAWHALPADQRERVPFSEEETADIATFWKAHLARQN